MRDEIQTVPLYLPDIQLKGFMVRQAGIMLWGRGEAVNIVGQKRLSQMKCPNHRGILITNGKALCRDTGSLLLLRET